jgi:hypothetical protein
MGSFGDYNFGGHRISNYSNYFSTVANCNTKPRKYSKAKLNVSIISNTQLSVITEAEKNVSISNIMGIITKANLTYVSTKVAKDISSKTTQLPFQRVTSGGLIFNILNGSRVITETTSKNIALFKRNRKEAANTNILTIKTDIVTSDNCNVKGMISLLFVMFTSGGLVIGVIAKCMFTKHPIYKPVAYELNSIV